MALAGTERPVTIYLKPDWRQSLTALASIVSVLVVAAGLLYSNAATQDQLEATRDGQVTERFTRAIDQLGQEGADKLSIRIGGIYALERLMHDSPEDEGAIIEVLCAFVRSHALPPKSKPGPPSAPDVQTAVIILGRRPSPYEPTNHLSLRGSYLAMPEADLAGAILSGADLSGADLSGADLVRADLHFADLSFAGLSSAYLAGATLVGAYLTGAHLSHTDLTDANLSGAGLSGATLTGATLVGTDLVGAFLFRADLTGANLAGANLIGANLTDATLVRANLTGATLAGADLSGADLTSADLTRADLKCARTDPNTRLPQGTPRPDLPGC